MSNDSDIAMKFFIEGAATLAARQGNAEDRVSTLIGFIKGNPPLLVAYNSRGDSEGLMRVLFLRAAAEAVAALPIEQRGRWQVLFLGIWADVCGDKAGAVQLLENVDQPAEVAELLVQWARSLRGLPISRLDTSHRDFAKEREDEMSQRYGLS